MKKIIVFGGSGFLGSHVADKLSSKATFNLILPEMINKYKVK